MTTSDIGIGRADQGTAALLRIPAVTNVRDLTSVLRDAGLFVYRYDADAHVIASTTLDPDGDHPTTVRVVRGGADGEFGVELAWAGGPPRDAVVDRAIAVVRSVSDRLSAAGRFARASEIDGNLMHLRRLWLRGQGQDEVAPVLRMGSGVVTIAFDRMSAAAARTAHPDSDPAAQATARPIVVRRARSDEVEVLVSGQPDDDALSIAVAATGPEWPGSVVAVTVTDGVHGSATYVVAMLGDATATQGRVVVGARSDEPVVTVAEQARLVSTLTADDAPAVRRSMNGVDEATLVFWLDVAEHRSSGDPVGSAVYEGLA